MKKQVWVAIAMAFAVSAAAEDLGQLSVNPYAPNSTGNPHSAAGSEYSSKSVRNPYGPYGNPYSNQSATNPYATDAPKLYDADGNYRGKLSSNPHDPDSISNPYGRYGNPYSADGINNPYGAGNPYRNDSPTNPYGKGLNMRSGDDERSSATIPRYGTRVPSTQSTRTSKSPWDVVDETESQEEQSSDDIWEQ